MEPNELVQMDLKCPYCHHDRFIRTIVEKIRMVDNGEYIADEQEGFTAQVTYVCANCGKDVTDKELER